MEDRKGYTDTDDLQADDQISPIPSSEEGEVRRPASSEGSSPDRTLDDDRQVPRPATSE